MAGTILAPQPVPFHGAVFFLVNATYIALCWELIYRTPADVPSNMRRIMCVRSIATLCLFGMAAVVALKYPLLGLGICRYCLIFYLKPDVPGAESVQMTFGPEPSAFRPFARSQLTIATP
jgi:hypothetical protein